MEEFYMYAITSIVLSSFIIVWWYGKGRDGLPPGPKGLPIVGYMPFLGSNLTHQFTDLAQKYGPIYKINLGRKVWVVVSSASVVKEVLHDKDGFFCNRDQSVAGQSSSWGGNGIGLPNADDPQWRILKRLFVQELMSIKRMDALYGLRRAEVRGSVRRIYEAGGKPVAISKLASEGAINLMLQMVWGRTVEGEEGARVAVEFKALVTKIIDLILVPNTSDFFPALAVFDLQGVKKKMEGYVRVLDGVLDAVISKRKTKNDEANKDLLQILLDFMDKTSITLPQLKATVMDTIAGGIDTTSSTIEWVMAELLNKPSLMAKAQKELEDVVGLNNIVEESHIPKLKYLEAAIKEAMRLHPPGPVLVPRTPTQPGVTLGGYSIPMNSKIMINVWGIQRDPSLWDNPTEFRPDRFLQNPNDFGVNQFKYLPFGLGKRSCAGKPLGERMVAFYLASLLHSFDWSLAPGEKLDMSETWGFSLRKTTPLFALPNPRLPHSDLYT